MQNKIDLFRVPRFNLCFSVFFFCIQKSFFCKYFSLSRCANHSSSSFKASLQQILDISLDKLLLQRRLIGWQMCGPYLLLLPHIFSTNHWYLIGHLSAWFQISPRTIFDLSSIILVAGCSDHPSPMQLPSLYSSYSLESSMDPHYIK